VLSEYLQNYFKYQTDLQNKTCLELGTGCGLVSITLSLLSAKQVIATDLENILEISQKNINENFSDNPRSNLLVTKLHWGEMDDINKIINQYPIIDYIFCSDCLYEESPWEKLLETLLFFSKVNPETEIIFAYKKRYVYQEYFLKEIEKYYNIETVSQDQMYAGFQKDTFFIIKLKFNKLQK
jgi:predicted nicotinamide N-methyase